MAGFPASPSTAAAPSADRQERATAHADQALQKAAPAPQAANAAAAPSVSKRLAEPLPGSIWDAARAGSALQVENLIQQGTPVDTRDNEGRTALMLAAMNGHTTTVQKLLALGANPKLVDRDGLTAAQWATQRGHTRLAELMNTAR